MSDAPLDSGGPPPASNVLSMVLVNRLEELATIGERIERFGRESGLAEDDTWHLNLVLDELVSNVIKYAHDDGLEHQILVTVVVDRGLLTVSIEDEGKPFNPLEAPPPNLDLPIEKRPLGKLGLFLVRSIMDTLEYRRERDRNVLTVQKRISSAPRAGQGPKL
jgi:anti-sigma regulatory factor (Ser/Thr protein kinase)